ncbi:MAG: TatD family hydrolase [Verrucomicrobiota bacterium]
MLIDTHAHLDYSDFEPDRDQVFQRAQEAGVTRMISIGTNAKTSANAVRLASSFPFIWATVGIHPTEVDEAMKSDFEILQELVQYKHVAAVGEIGFDFHHLPGKELSPEEAAPLIQKNKEAQEYWFRKQLDLAVSHQFNVVIHQRDAWDDTLRVLREYRGKVRGVYHCFGGTYEQAMEVIELGNLVSFTGIITFKNAKQVQETARLISSDHFMVETDCPYLAPVPYRGKRCEPFHTRLVAEKIAELRGVSLEEIARSTSRVAESFFRLQD